MLPVLSLARVCRQRQSQGDYTLKNLVIFHGLGSEILPNLVKIDKFHEKKEIFP